MEMECKTPVNLLQEYLIKDGVLPCYKLVLSGTGNNPTFEWEVSAKGVTIAGRGKSKKEAKHDAAKRLLLKLKRETMSKQQVHVELPYEKDIKENSVGALHEYCVKRHVVPRYEVIREDGKNHLKVFVIRCTVLSHSTEAEARSKKQAKHKASQLMLFKLSNGPQDETDHVSLKDEVDNVLLKDEVDHVPLKDEADHIPLKDEVGHVESGIEAFEISKIAIENELRRREMNNRGGCASSNIDFSFTRDYSVFFKEKVLPKSVTLQAIVNCDDAYLESHIDPECVLKTILNQLDYDFELDYLDSRSKNHFLCHICIKDLNNADFIGVAKNRDGAKRNAVIKALKFIVIMSR